MLFVRILPSLNTQAYAHNAYYISSIPNSLFESPRKLRVALYRKYILATEKKLFIA